MTDPAALQTPRPWVPLLAVLAHVLVLTQYGWFRDEFYYLACAAHLDYGYVDHPALSILPLWLVRQTVGDSLVAIRLLAAASMGVTVWLIGKLTAALGGGRFAATLAMTCAAVAPIFLSYGSYYSMNVFDVGFWALVCWLFVRAMPATAPGTWVALGIDAGLGVENKISMLWLLAGLAVGLAVTAPRRLLTRGPWLAAACAAVLSAPYLVWQLQHDWATAEFIRGASTEKM
ncbi:MAG: glycosyltransferase family 39 protein, partial [Acidobacteria bacterium]|nr:glycosyltransferase family 39 protein [Acidobacteriota bacterium]